LSIILFSGYIFIGFWNEYNAGFTLNWVVFLPFLFSGKIWGVLVVVLRGLVKFSRESFRLFFVGRLLQLGLLRCSRSSWFNFGWLYSPRSLSISYRFSSLLEYKFSKYTLMILWILLIFVTYPLFHLWFLIWVFSLLRFVMLAKDLSILFIFAQSQLSVSLILCVVIFGYNLIDLSPDLFISLCLLV
jgi:hypothetical protein